MLIPNRDVYKSVIRVQTHFEVRRVSFIVGIAYENDAAEACDAITDALGGIDGVVEEPAPEAFITELGTSAVDVQARLWTGPGQHNAVTVLSRAIAVVKTALEDHDIEMPADITALQATPSFAAALQGNAEVTPGGSVRQLENRQG